MRPLCGRTYLPIVSAITVVADDVPPGVDYPARRAVDRRPTRKRCGKVLSGTEPAAAAIGAVPVKSANVVHDT